MLYTSETTERNAAINVAELMTAAARTAPKACGVDCIETMVLDGEDKDKLTAAMRETGTAQGKAFFIRDAGNVDASHCIVLIGADTSPRGLNCGLCGTKNCAAAKNGGILSAAVKVKSGYLTKCSYLQVQKMHHLEANKKAASPRMKETALRLCYSIVVTSCLIVRANG